MQFTKKDINKTLRNGEQVAAYSSSGQGTSQQGISYDTVRRNFVSIEFFKRLFQAHDSTDSNNILNIDPNDMDSTITDIQFNFGAWSNYYLSALGQNSTGGGGGGGGLDWSALTTYDNNPDHFVNPLYIPIGSGLSIVNGELTATGSGSGSVTSVGLSMPTGFNVSGSPVTSSGTISVSLSSGYKLLTSSTATPGTYTKVTVDTYGRVTSGSTISASDIPSLSASKITSGTFDTARIPTNISITGNAATATKASKVIDSYNTSKEITITYAKDGQSSTSWLASWNGYELGSISPSNITAGAASQLSTSRTLWGQPFNGAANVSGNMTSVGSITATGDITVTKSDAKISVSNGSSEIGLNNDVNRGVWDYSTSRWLITTNGTNSWLNCGNVGIGTSSPGYKLHVEGMGYFSEDVQIRNSSYGGAQFSLGSSSYPNRTFTISQRNTSGNWVANYMIFGSNGYVGIGNIEPSYMLHVSGDIGLVAGSRITQGNTSGNALFIGSSTNAGWVRLQDMCSQDGTAGDTYWSIRTNGNAIFANMLSRGFVTALSDIRYKNVVSYVNTRIEDISNLPLFYFKWKYRDGDDMHIGTSAQAVQKIFPELVLGSEELSVDYGVLGTTIGILLCKRIMALEEKIKELEGK